MALKNVKDISKRYIPKFDRAKESFKARTGKKIARGFKDSPEFKKILRNERRAIQRFEKNNFKQPVEELAEIDPNELIDLDETESLKDIEAIDQQSSFYNVLSYGSRSDKLAMQMFNDNKGNNNFQAVLDFRNQGLGMSVHNDQTSFDMKMKWIYRRLLSMQKNKKLGSMGTLVNTTIGQYKGNTTLIVQSEF